MTLRNTPTGRRGICETCGEVVEEARLLHGVREHNGKVMRGVLVWRTLDAGFASTRCGAGYHAGKSSGFVANVGSP